MSEAVATEGGGEAAAPASEPTGASAVLSAVGDAPSAPTEPVSASAAVGQTPAETAWHEGKGYSADTVQLMEAKGWHKSENPAEALSKAYRNLERLRGVPGDQLVRLPEPGNEEQTAEFYQRLGVPEAPEGYESPEVKALGQPIEAAPLAAISHALHHTPEQHAAFMGEVATFLETTAQQQAEARNAALSAEKVELDREWGPTLEENTLAAKKGFDAIGWDSATIDAVEQVAGYQAVMKLGAMVGRMVSEVSRGDDGSGDTPLAQPFGLTPGAAREQLSAKGAELTQKALAGDKAAARELNELNRVAFHSR